MGVRNQINKTVLKQIRKRKLTISRLNFFSKPLKQPPFLTGNGTYKQIYRHT